MVELIYRRRRSNVHTLMDHEDDERGMAVSMKWDDN